MHKLLSANFARLWRDKVFWLGMAGMVIFAVSYILYSASYGTDRNISLSNYIPYYAIYIGIFCAIFAALFLGKEYSDGTVRNKLIVGHRRFEIYIANLLTVYLATLMFIAAWLIGVSALIPVFGMWKSSIVELIVPVAISIFFVAAFSAIFTLVALLCSNKAITAVMSILIFMGLLLIGSMVDGRLSQPPEVYEGGMTIYHDMETDSSVVSDLNLVPNPLYLTEEKRIAWEFWSDFLPSGQSLSIGLGQMGNPLRMICSSLFLTALVTAVGIYSFNRKNIR